MVYTQKILIFKTSPKLVNITYFILSSGFLIKIFAWRFSVACNRRRNPMPDGRELKKYRWDSQRQSEAPKPETGIGPPLMVASTAAHWCSR
jgi:hypothetical protein